MNTSIAIQVLPQNVGEKKIVEIVDKVIDYIQSTGVRYYVGPFETTLEGELSELMEIAQKCQSVAVDSGCDSVMSYIKIHYQTKGGVLSIDEKIQKYH